MNRVFKICLLVLVALTVGHMQVFGVQRGFICEDQAQPQEMNAAHCHRANGEKDTDFVPCKNREPGPDCPKGEVSQHLELKVKMESVKQADAGAVVAPSFIPVVTLADIAAFEYLLELIASQPCSDSLLRFQEEAGKHETTSVLVAECVILLV